VKIYDTVSAEELLSGEYDGEYVLLGNTYGHVVRAETSDIEQEAIDILLEDEEYFGERVWHVLLADDAVSLITED
jgi:hypothetical protein